MSTTQIRGNTQIMDYTVDKGRLVENFLAGADWNITNGNNNATITGLKDPVNARDAVTKQYADAIASGFGPKRSVRLATTGELTATYSNGTGGVGATLTNSGTQVALSVDGVAAVVGNRILVKDQTGVAEVTDVTCAADVAGSLNNKYFWIFTRAKSYYVWFNVNSGGADPAPTAPSGGPATTQGVEIAIATSATAAQVGDAVQTAVHALADFNATDDNAGVVTITNAVADNVKDAIDGNTVTFSFSTTTQGTDLRIQNGIYVVTNIGSGSTNWVLERASDFDNSPDGEILPGDFVPVEAGATLAGYQYYQVDFTSAGVVGTDDITFSVFANPLVLGDDVIKDNMIDWGTGAGQVSAADIPIADAGNYFGTDTVEAALQALGANAGGTMVYQELPAVTNGNPAVTLAHTPIANTEEVYLNGVRQIKGASYDYTIATNTVTFTSNLHTNDQVFVAYRY